MSNNVTSRKVDEMRDIGWQEKIPDSFSVVAAGKKSEHKDAVGMLQRSMMLMAVNKARDDGGGTSRFLFCYNQWRRK